MPDDQSNVRRRALQEDGRRCSVCGVPLWECESVDFNKPVVGKSGATYYPRLDWCVLCCVNGVPPKAARS